MRKLRKTPPTDRVPTLIEQGTQAAVRVRITEAVVMPLLALARELAKAGRPETIAASETIARIVRPLVEQSERDGDVCADVASKLERLH